MKSRLLLNVGLLAIVVVLAALAFFEPGKKKPENTPLAAVDENTLNAITLKNQDTIVFEKKDGHWRLAAPFAAPANEVRVKQLIGIAQSPVEVEYPVQGENLAKFELDKPKATLTLGTKTLVFGGSDPINMRRYVRVGDKLDLVNDDFSHHLSAPATDWVDKKLLPEDAKLKEITIPGLKVILGSDGKWTKEPADSQAIPTELAAAWTTARAIDVQRLEKPGQGDTIRLVPAEGNPVEFVIVQKEPDLILARPDLGLQYELTDEIARSLLALPKAEPAAGNPADEAPGSEADGEMEGEDHDEEAGEDDGGEDDHEGEAGKHPDDPEDE